MYVVLHQVVRDSVLRLTPEDCITLEIHLKTEFEIVSVSDVLTRILKDNIIDQLSDELSIVHVFSLILLGVVHNVVIHHSRFQMELWFHDLCFTRYLDELIKRETSKTTSRAISSTP